MGDQTLTARTSLTAPLPEERLTIRQPGRLQRCCSRQPSVYRAENKTSPTGRGCTDAPQLAAHQVEEIAMIRHHADSRLVRMSTGDLFEMTEVEELVTNTDPSLGQATSQRAALKSRKRKAIGLS